MVRLRMILSMILAGLMGFSATAEALKPVEPLKFKSWKEQQILEAQNEVLRISARLHQQKNNPKNDKKEQSSHDLDEFSRFERAPDATDKDLKNAQESLTIARELSLEDYAAVYVANLQEDDPDQFARLMDSLSRDELAQLMKILVKNKNSEPDDAKRKKTASAADATVSSNRP